MRIISKIIVATVCLTFASLFSSVQITQAESIPESAYISGFSGHPQQYVLSCEARSAVDWMAFWGIQVSEDDFIYFLPRSDNPNKGLVGEPNDVWGNLPPLGYGVHAEPVAALLRSYGFSAEARRGFTWDELRNEIAAGRPVIVWVIGEMWVFKSREVIDTEGEKALVAPFEHTMVAIGYDASIVYLVDAFSGLTVSYWQQAFFDSWAVLDNMAVTGSLPPPPEPTSTPEPAPTNTPTVVPRPPQFLPGKIIFLPFISKPSIEVPPTPTPTLVISQHSGRPRLHRR